MFNSLILSFYLLLGCNNVHHITYRSPTRTNSGKDDTPLKFNSENSRVHGQKSEEVETKDRDEVTITMYNQCVSRSTLQETLHKQLLQ